MEAWGVNQKVKDAKAHFFDLATYPPRATCGRKAQLNHLKRTTTTDTKCQACTYLLGEDDNQQERNSNK